MRLFRPFFHIEHVIRFSKVICYHMYIGRYFLFLNVNILFEIYYMQNVSSQLLRSSPVIRISCLNFEQIHIYWHSFRKKKNNDILSVFIYSIDNPADIPITRVYGYSNIESRMFFFLIKIKSSRISITIIFFSRLKTIGNMSLIATFKQTAYKLIKISVYRRKKKKKTKRNNINSSSYMYLLLVILAETVLCYTKGCKTRVDNIAVRHYLL